MLTLKTHPHVSRIYGQFFAPTAGHRQGPAGHCLAASRVGFRRLASACGAFWRLATSVLLHPSCGVLRWLASTCVVPRPVIVRVRPIIVRRRLVSAFGVLRRLVVHSSVRQRPSCGVRLAVSCVDLRRPTAGQGQGPAGHCLAASRVGFRRLASACCAFWRLAASVL